MYGSSPATKPWQHTNVNKNEMKQELFTFQSCLLVLYCCKVSFMTLFEAAYVGTEEWHVSRSQFVAKIDVAMGGRAAEEIVFGKDKVQ